MSLFTSQTSATNYNLLDCFLIYSPETLGNGNTLKKQSIAQILKVQSKDALKGVIPKPPDKTCQTRP